MYRRPVEKRKVDRHAIVDVVASPVTMTTAADGDVPGPGTAQRS